MERKVSTSVRMGELVRGIPISGSINTVCNSGNFYVAVFLWFVVGIHPQNERRELIWLGWSVWQPSERSLQRVDEGLRLVEEGGRNDYIIRLQCLAGRRWRAKIFCYKHSLSDTTLKEGNCSHGDGSVVWFGTEPRKPSDVFLFQGRIPAHVPAHIGSGLFPVPLFWSLLPVQTFFLWMRSVVFVGFEDDEALHALIPGNIFYRVLTYLG